MLVEVLFAYGEGLEALLELNDQQGLVRVRAPEEWAEKFWRERADDIWPRMDKDKRTALRLVGEFAGMLYHFFHVIRGPDGALAPDVGFDEEYQSAFQRFGPPVTEYIFPTDQGMGQPGPPVRRLASVL